MTPEHIREFSLLELLVLGELSKSEQLEVETAMATYPELKEEFKEIEYSLEVYAQAHSIAPPEYLLGNILDEIKQGKAPPASTQSKPAGKSNILKNIILGLLSLGLLTSIIWLFQSRSSINELNSEIEKEKQLCDSLQIQSNKIIDQYRSIVSDNNNRIEVQPTDNYPETKLIFNTNSAEERNFIQVDQLPPIAENQSFQLWSLRADLDPMPLNVFDESYGDIFEVQFVEGTTAYAITIEKKGGSQAPTLDNLIGVFAIQG